MKPKYLFIDDETGGPTTALLDGFKDTGLLSVIPLSIDKNDTFESICGKIVEQFAQQDINGILIDLCLDGAGENSMYFKAPPLAQQIRSKASEGVIKQCPIVLCSTVENMDTYYTRDKASHDLFDYYFNKTDSSFMRIATRLASMAKGYLQLMGEWTVESILNRPKAELLDLRIVNYLEEETLSPFDVSQFIVKSFFSNSGILINEDVLAARMGVNREASGVAWLQLKNAIEKEAQYNGIFADGWKRYWADKVGAYYSRLSGGIPCQASNAHERIEVLTRMGFDGITAAEPIKFNKSTYFNTICEYYKLPIDSMEGIPIEDSALLKPWQEHHYVSFYALAKGDFPEVKIGIEGKKKYAEMKKRIEYEQQA